MLPNYRRVLSGHAAELERLLTSFHDMRGQIDGQRMKELVELRRRLATQVAATATTVREILPCDGGAGPLRDFSRLHSAFLSSLALHQANWPVVLLLEKSNEEGYVTSARAVDRAGRSLAEWLRLAAGRG